jgi:hypothetical protein
MDTTHIEGSHVSNSKWIGKYQYMYIYRNSAGHFVIKSNYKMVQCINEHNNPKTHLGRNSGWLFSLGSFLTRHIFNPGKNEVFIRTKKVRATSGRFYLKRICYITNASGHPGCQRLVHKTCYPLVIRSSSGDTLLRTRFGCPNRVTRLGKFLPIGWLFSFGSFLQITEIAQIIGLLFSAVYMFSVWPKMAWATFWVILSQTHLVTLSSQLWADDEQMMSGWQAGNTSYELASGEKYWSVKIWCSRYKRFCICM